MINVREDRLAIVSQRLKTLDHITGAIKELQSAGCRFSGMLLPGASNGLFQRF